VETTVFEFVNWDGSVVLILKDYPETVDDLVTIMKEEARFQLNPQHRFESFDHVLHRRTTARPCDDASPIASSRHG
jgi:hypothetical protein